MGRCLPNPDDVARSQRTIAKTLLPLPTNKNVFVIPEALFRKCRSRVSSIIIELAWNIWSTYDEARPLFEFPNSLRPNSYQTEIPPNEFFSPKETFIS